MLWYKSWLETRWRFVIGLVLLIPASGLHAQTAVDPSGHWEGLIKMPEMEMAIEIDLAKNANGTLAGTFANPHKA
jgi:hypothetical protein